MIKLYAKKRENLLKYLTNFEGLNYNKIQSIFRKKDIKVNGKRVNENLEINEGDCIEIYCKNDVFFNISTIFEDENIIIVSKPKKLEVVSETKNISLLNLINPDYFAVHRLDFNTEGLVIFAKNLTAKNELDFAFKNSLIQKNYITICKNIPQKNEQIFEDFLLKNNNFVQIFNKNVPNSKKILTKIKVLKTKSSNILNKNVLKNNLLNNCNISNNNFNNIFNNDVLNNNNNFNGNIINNKNLNNYDLNIKDFYDKNLYNKNLYSNNSHLIKNKIKIDKKNDILNNNQTSFSLIDVCLLTGRTHQIRAHLAFHNLFVLGDEKYGDFIINKKLNIKTQILRCYMLKFDNLDGKLSYLNKKTFEIPTNDIYEIFEKI